MENKKQLKTYQLITAIASTLVTIGYFGLFHFKFDYLFGEISGGLFKLLGYAFDAMDRLGVSFGEILSEIFDDETVSVLVIVLFAAYIIPFVLNLIAAIKVFVDYAKNRNMKACQIIVLISTAYTTLMCVIMAIGMAVLHQEDVTVITLGWGYYIQVIAAITAIVFAILLLVKSPKASDDIPISDTDVGLVGVCGMYEGEEFFNNSGRPIVIGRDALQCDVVISENAEKVSRKHCTVNFDYKNNMYLVTDHSSNGTHLDNGKRLLREVETPVECGTVIILGDEKNAFRLN